jgi:RHS repeat-associated protein
MAQARSWVRIVTLAVSVGLVRCQPLLADTNTSLGDHGGEGSTAFTGLAKAPSANLFTGALTTSIPVEVPPGRKNMTPQLALQYSSSAGPSIYGYGWDLPLGRMQHSAKWGVPGCTGTHTDDFVLTLPSGTVELTADPPGSDTYRPTVEQSYLEAQKNTATNSWVVYDRSGMKYVFGDAPWARVGTDTSVFMRADANGGCRFTTAWALTRVEDPNGNWLQIQYASISNTLYPVSVDYGGNTQTALAHFYHVKFSYETRPDRIESGLSGAPAVILLRLHTIRIATNVPAYTEFRTYTLHYDVPPNGQNGYQSVLSAVEETGYPSQVFVYADSAAGLNPEASSQTYTAPQGLSALRIANASGEVSQTVMDMDGDGFLDLVQANPPNAPCSPASCWLVYRGTHSGFATTGTRWYVDPSVMANIRDVYVSTEPCDNDGWSCTDRDTFDITGDGIPDFVDARTIPWWVYPGVIYPDGTHEFDSNRKTQWPSQGVRLIRKDWREEHDPPRATRVFTFQDVLDVNGDGLPDLVISGSPPHVQTPSSWTVYLNNGHGFDPVLPYFPAPANTIGWQDVYPGDNGSGYVAEELMDFNGDGLLDLLLAPRDLDPRCQNNSNDLLGCLEVYVNTGQGFSSAPQLAPVPYGPLRKWDSQGRVDIDIFDVNGDGLPDLVEYVGPQSIIPAISGAALDAWYVLLNRGGTLEHPVTHALDPSLTYAVWPGPSARTWPGGDGYIRQTTTGGAYAYIDMIDFNGDGMLDRVVAAPNTWTVQLTRNSPKPNLLTEMQNGLGGTTTVLYEPSTSFDNTGGDGVPDLPFVTWLASDIRQTDALCTPPWDYSLRRLGFLFVPQLNECISNGHELASAFTYQDGRFDPSSREFRGFRRVYRTNTNLEVAATTFGQEAATKGKVLYAGSYTGGVDVDSLVRSVETWWRTNAIGTNRTQLSLELDVVHHHDLKPVPSDVIAYNDPPDAFGNIRHTRSGVVGGRVDTYTDYATPVGSSRVHDKPWHTYSLYTGPGFTAQRFNEKWFVYDGGPNGLTLGTVDGGNVKVVESWLDTGPGNPQTRMTYDAYGNMIGVEDALGNPTTTIYDDGHQTFLYPHEVINALGYTSITETDYRWGKPVAVTDATGAVTQYSYDVAGRPSCVARPGDSLRSCSTRYTYTYGAANVLSSVKIERKEPNNHAGGYLPTTEYFDALGRHRHTAAFGVVEGAARTVIRDRTDYDAAGRVAQRYSPYLLAPGTDAATPNPPTNGATRYDYHFAGTSLTDPLGRLYQVSQRDGTVRTTTYNQFWTTMQDEERHKTVTQVNALGRVVERDVYNGDGGRTPYTVYSNVTSQYDGAGRLTRTTQNGNANTSIAITYDSLGRKLQMTDPDSGTWRYGYDPVGNLLYQDDPKTGQHLEFCYDALNRVTDKFYRTGDSHGPPPCGSRRGDVAYAYDEDGSALGCDLRSCAGAQCGIGRLTHVDEQSGNATVLCYDVRGRRTRVVTTISAGGRTTTGAVSYRYDSAGHVTRMAYPDGERVTYRYDAAGQIRDVRGKQRYVKKLTYDLFGRPRVLTHGNHVTDTRTYGDQRTDFRLAAMETTKRGTVLLHYTYPSYSARGLLQELVDTTAAAATALDNGARFSYDDLGRLSGASGPNLGSLTWQYDAAGNIVQHEGRTLCYDNAAHPHQVTRVCTGTCTSGLCTAVAHDPNGNRQAKDNNAQMYTYTPDDRVESITVGGQAVRFVYDYTGHRVAKIEGARVTRYYGSWAEASDDGTLTKYYFVAGLLVASQRVPNTVLAGLPPEPAVMVAGAAPGRRAVVLLVRKDVQRGGLLAVGVIGTGLLLAPWRRKRVVGMAIRHGHVIGIIVVFGVVSLPLPLVVRPAAASTGIVMHYHVDHLGSPQLLTDRRGYVVEYIRYTPYGEVRGHYDALGTALSSDCSGGPSCREFTGYDTEPVSGLQYAGARVYDPSLGTFLTHDPVRQFANPYAYGPWDPINGTDPNGTIFGIDDVIISAIIIGAIVGFAVSAIQAGVNGANFGQALKAGVSGGAIGAVTGAGLGVLDVAVTPALLPVLHAIELAGGAYSTAEGFRNGQYFVGAVGVVGAAFGVDGLYKDFKGVGMQPPHGSNGAGQALRAWRATSDGTQAGSVSIDNNPWHMLEGDVLDFVGGLYGTARGIAQGVYEIGAGIATLDSGQIEQGLYDFGSSFAVPRLDAHGGLNWPGTKDNYGLFLESGTQVENASIWHDRAVGSEPGGFFHSSNQFGWITRAWTGPGVQPGLYGQAYRLLGTLGFGAAGTVEWGLGY